MGLDHVFRDSKTDLETAGFTRDRPLSTILKGFAMRPVIMGGSGLTRVIGLSGAALLMRILTQGRASR